MTTFRKGQRVYILGRYRAKVIEERGTFVECDVYEGLSPNMKPPYRGTYSRSLVEPERKKVGLDFYGDQPEE